MNTASQLHFKTKIDWKAITADYIVAEHTERKKILEGKKMHAPIVSTVEAIHPCFLVPRTGFFKSSEQEPRQLIAHVNQSDVGSGTTPLSRLLESNATQQTMGRQTVTSFFDVAKALEQCILVKDVQKYRAAKQVKRGFVRAVIANFIMCVLFGMGYSSLDPSTRATLLNLIMRHSSVKDGSPDSGSPQVTN